MKCFLSRWKQDKGYVLPYALLLILIVTLMLFGYLSLISFYNKQANRQIKKKKLDLICQSAMQLILSDPGEYINQEVIHLDSSRVNISRYNIGLFNKYILTTRDEVDSSSVEYLIGSTIPDFGQNALTITRPNLRLTVAGETKIKGNILATSDNVTKGNIFGIKNSNSPFLEGEIVVSENLQSKLFPDSLVPLLFTPPLDLLVIETLIINNSFIENLNKAHPINILTENHCVIESNTVSFSDINLFAKEDVLIESNVSLRNLNLFTEGKIIVSENCSFQNVQFFSGDSISINNSVFNYPSVLGLHINTSETEILNKSIDLNSSIFNGSIILTSDMVGLSSNNCKIKIDKNSTVHGFIYCENNLELLGKLYGIAYTYNTFFYQDPTQYINWLVNMSIDRSKLDKWFCFPVGFENSLGYKIIEETWIY